MQARIARLEDQVTGLRIDAARVETKVDGLGQHMATKAWVLTGALAVLVAIVGAAWWMVQQYLAPILQHLGK